MDKLQLKPMALSINYEANEDFKECPYKVKISGQKSLYIVLIVPLINEIQRTLDDAFENQKLNFQYYQNKLDGQYSELKKNAASYAESIKTGNYQHVSYDIDAKINAPVLIIPESIFDPDSNYIQLKIGKISVASILQEYNNWGNPSFYANKQTDDGLYDEYVISLDGMSLGVFSNKSLMPLVSNITFELRIESCLEPKHDKFPTLRLNIEIDKKIDLHADLNCIKKMFRIIDFASIQMER